LAKREVTENDIEIVKMLKEHSVPSTTIRIKRKENALEDIFHVPNAKTVLRNLFKISLALVRRKIIATIYHLL